MRAIIYLAIATIFLGLNFHLAKIVLKEVDFIEAGFWRFLFGVVALVILGFKNLPSIKKVQENLKGISFTGFIGFFGVYLLFFF